MIARLDPFDTFFFRDGKPFSLGDESWADGVFPPAPSVLYGALRTLYLASNGGFDRSKAELDKATEGLVIKGIYLEYDGNLHFPLPLDVVKNDEDKKDIRLLQLKSPPQGAIFNQLTSHLLGLEEKGISVEEIEKGALLENGDYTNYLNGKAPIHHILPAEYLSSEPKIGIGRDNSRRSVSEGELFRVDMKRLLPYQEDVAKPTRIVVEFEFEKWNLNGNQLGKMGGEGKVVSYELDNTTKLSIPGFPTLTTNASGKIPFKICLTTPAIFKHGWYPGWLDKDLKGSLNGVDLQLLAAVTDRAISIGGWDLKERGPKIMYKAMPAGSVYCFETETTDTEKIKEAFHGKSVSDFMSKEGFGISLVGKV